MLRLDHKNWLVVILAAGLAVRLIFFAFLHDDARFTIDDDSTDYLTLSENIRLGNGFSNSTVAPYAPNTFRTPGYPVFLLVHKVLTGTYQAALITQSILVVLSAWILARIGYMLEYRRIGLL